MALTSPRIGFCGMTHLGQTLKKASEIRGFETSVGYRSGTDIMFVALDVDDHDDLDEITTYMEYAIELPVDIPVVLVSQVPPGFTRPWLKKRGNIFYQVDTIIMNHALERATLPERIIVGCEAKFLGDGFGGVMRGSTGNIPALIESLPPPYATYLAAFNCPIFKESFEEAELTKVFINGYLAKQIDATNEFAKIARHFGADWNRMIPGLRLDARIGPHAYIRPGEVGGHLPRDVRTIERLLKEANGRDETKSTCARATGD